MSLLKDLQSRNQAGSGSLISDLTRLQPQAGDEEERQKPIISGSNLFMKALDTINTPQQAIWGGLRGAIEGKPIGQSAVQGMRENASFTDVLKSAGVGEMGTSPPLPLIGEVTGRGTLGLAADIIADPINLLPGGILAKPFIAAGKKATPALAKTHPALRFLDRPPQERSIQELIAKQERVFQAASREIRREGMELEKRVQGIGERTGIPREEVGRRITKEAERKKFVQTDMPEIRIAEAEATVDRVLRRELNKAMGLGKPKKGQISFRRDTAPEDLKTIAMAKVASAPYVPPAAAKEIPEIASEAAVLSKRMKDILMDEHIRGLGTINLSDVSLDYVTHVLTDQAKKSLLSASTELQQAGRQFNARHGFQLVRKWRGKSIDELNALAKRGELPGFEGVTIDKLFVDDPAVIQTVRGLRGAKANADAELFIQAAVKLGRKADEVPKGSQWQPLALIKSDDARLNRLKSFLGEYVFDPDVRKHLDAHYELMFNPKSPTRMDEFLGLFDQVQGVWKSITLFPFPAYHARNFVGNVFNNYLGGVINPQHYVRAASFQITDDAARTFQLGQKSFTKGELDKLLTDYGVIDQFRSYLAIPESSLLKPSLAERVPILGKGVKAGLRVGTAIEDNTRIAHFMAKLERGSSPIEAALSTKKHLFDYNALTAFEKATLRRAFPFYSWTRYNVPLQIRSIVEQPHKFQPLGDISEALKRDRGLPSDIDKVVANWVRENSGIPVSEDEDGNPQFFLLGGWLPAADINSLSKPIREIKASLTPFLKTPIELLANRDLFFGGDIESFPGEKGRFLGAPIPKKAIHILRNLRFLTEADRLLAAVAKGMDLNITDRKGEDLTDAVIRTLFGAKIYPVELAKERRKMAQERRGLMLKRRRDLLQKQGINTSTIDRMLEELR